MTLNEAIARENIRQTITNYTIAGDNRDAALFNVLWAEDALFEFEFPPLPPFRCNGIADIGPDHAGNYIDKLVRQGERWLFAHRRVELVWRSPDSCFPPVKR